LETAAARSTAEGERIPDEVVGEIVHVADTVIARPDPVPAAS